MIFDVRHKMMKKAILAVLRYVVAIAIACVFAGFSSSPFLKPGDFSVPMQMIFVAAMSGLYIVAFTPIVILTEVFIRARSGHQLLPLWAIPIFGLCFPVLGFVLFSRRWWPEEPTDMDIRHILTFVLLAAASIGIAAVVMYIKNKSRANKALNRTSESRAEARLPESG